MKRRRSEGRCAGDLPELRFEVARTEGVVERYGAAAFDLIKLVIGCGRVHTAHATDGCLCGPVGKRGH